jgi:glycosyltransferase involved in cell wall biosynthesis
MLGPSEPARILQEEPPRNGWPVGDGGQPVNDLARGLVQAGVEVTLVSLSSEIERVWTHKEGRLQIVLIPMRANPRRRLADLYAVEGRRLRRAIARVRYDIVHAHWTYVYAHAALSRDPNALVSLHDSPRRLLALSPSPGLLALSLQTAWTARKARNLVATSPYVAGTWVSDFRGREPIGVVPNMTPEFPASSCPKVQTRSIVSLGHPHPNKNLKGLIAAWPEIVAQVPNVKLFIAGAGTEEGGAFDDANQASRMGINMLGQVSRSELARLLAEASLMVHPSLSEACPMSIIEALSFGLPCVAGAQAGPMEWMLGLGGSIVDVTDPVALARATIRLLSDSAAYSEARAGAFEASRRFDPSVIITQWIEVYDQLMASNSA